MPWDMLRLLLHLDGFQLGEMSEWFKEPVLKTGDPQGPWVRIPLSPPDHNSIISMFSTRGSTQVAEGAPLLRE